MKEIEFPIDFHLAVLASHRAAYAANPRNRDEWEAAWESAFRHRRHWVEWWRKRAESMTWRDRLELLDAILWMAWDLRHDRPQFDLWEAAWAAARPHGVDLPGALDIPAFHDRWMQLEELRHSGE